MPHKDLAARRAYQREYHCAWRKRNIEKVRKEAAAYYRKNKKRIDAANKAREIKNRQVYRVTRRIWLRKWRATNRDLTNAKQRIYRKTRRLKSCEYVEAERARARKGYYKHREQRLMKVKEYRSKWGWLIDKRKYQKRRLQTLNGIRPYERTK